MWNLIVWMEWKFRLWFQNVKNTCLHTSECMGYFPLNVYKTNIRNQKVDLDQTLFKKPWITKDERGSPGCDLAMTMTSRLSLETSPSMSSVIVMRDNSRSCWNVYYSIENETKMYKSINGLKVKKLNCVLCSVL